MAKQEQESLDSKQKLKLLEELEKLGESRWKQNWKEHIGFPIGINPSSSEQQEIEKVLRFLLLRTIINQQAQADKAREISKLLFSEFEDQLLFQPFQVDGEELFALFRKVAGEKGRGLYKVGALGGIKTISLFSYRFKAFEEFIRWLDKKNQSIYGLIFESINQMGVKGLLKELAEHQILGAGWVGNDPKACRMMVDWIVFLIVEVWKKKVPVNLTNTVMIVDGHVGKVFSRTGLLREVIYDKNRPYIIEANDMRPDIERIVSESNLVPFYVDNGAYYLFKEGFCLELTPQCFQCPINALCLKHIKWTGYQKWRESI